MMGVPSVLGAGRQFIEQRLAAYYSIALSA